MTEEWRDIKGYEGYYQVSNLGRVRSVDRYCACWSSVRFVKGALKNVRPHNGYLVVDLSLNGKSKTISVHRLVAQAFIPNTDNLPQVNHKDENKQNNCVDNLEWCTCEYNIKYGTRLQRQSNTIREQFANGRVNGMTGRHHSEEMKCKLSKDRMGDKNPMYGKKRNVSAETRQKIRKGNLLWWENHKKCESISSRKINKLF